MKKIYWMAPLGIALCLAPFAAKRAFAASNTSRDLDTPTESRASTRSDKATNTANAIVTRATSTFDNARPDKGETSWGRFVADALRARTKADIAFINAGALERGTLSTGEVRENDIAALLSFGDDEVATLTLNGTQLRAALERAVSAFPTASPAWLHLSGATASFNPKSPNNARLKTLQVNGRDAEASDTFTVAMPIGLAEGGSGYYKIWKGIASTKPTVSGASLLQTVVAYARSRKEISPDITARLRVG